MRYILYILFLGSLVFGNDELNSYLNNKDLQYSIIKDEKNNRIIIDLLYDLKDSSRIIIFTKNNNGNYKKTFDEKLYFCQNIKYSNIMVKLKNNLLNIVCAMSNVDDGYYLEFYDFGKLSTLDDKLLSIEKQYINIDNDTIKNSYIFKPKKDIPTLKDYKNEKFSDKYLNENYKNFIKIDSNKKTIIQKKQPLYKSPNKKTKMYLIKNDKVEILEEKDDWYYILYHGKKDIKAWIPKSAVE